MDEEIARKGHEPSNIVLGEGLCPLAVEEDTNRNNFSNWKVKTQGHSFLMIINTDMDLNDEDYDYEGPTQKYAMIEA